MSKENKSSHEEKGMDSNRLTDRKPSVSLEDGAVSLENRRRLDSSFYEKKYPEMRFMWRNDVGGELQRWLQAGAEPQAEETEKFGKQFAGLTDRNDGGWVREIGGVNASGEPYFVYLLKMSREAYKKVKTDPTNARNQEVKDAMGMKAKSGVADGSDRDGSKLDTYAPETGTGSAGFEQIGGKVAFNQIVDK